jgi:O-methyltransferase involved in polyketide biosynthesis
MSDDKRLIRNISDTARWVASYRAAETARPDAVFRDPYAEKLAGERGKQIAAAMPYQEKNSWPFVARTVCFDSVITKQIQGGVDTVINLAAGLCARPYRMAVPPTLKWIEVDLPEILDYKEEILANEKPVCSLQRIRADLADVEGRRKLFAELGSKAGKALIVTEGLIAYLSPEEVGVFARDLTVPPSFQRWTNDFGSPGLLKMIQKQVGDHLTNANAPLKFGPPEGPGFFEPFGWKPIEICSLFKTAARLKRLPLLLRLMAIFPESNGKQGKQPWSAVCLFAKK